MPINDYEIIRHFPHITYNYKSLEEIESMDRTSEQRIGKKKIKLFDSYYRNVTFHYPDFIGIFSDWIEEEEIMTLITPSGKVSNIQFIISIVSYHIYFLKLIINVGKAIEQVPHQDYIQMVNELLLKDTTISFKNIKMKEENFNCFVDTIIKVNQCKFSLMDQK